MLPLCKFPLPEAAAAAERCFSRRGGAHPALGYFCRGSLWRRRGSSSLSWHRSTAPTARPHRDPDCSRLVWPGVTEQLHTQLCAQGRGSEHLFIRRCRIWAQVDGIPSPPAPRGCSQPKGRKRVFLLPTFLL